MKILIKMFFCALVGILTLSSCSKSDENKITLTTSMVVGRWDVTYAEQDGKSINIPAGSIYMKLDEDNTYVTHFFTNYYVGKYKLQGDTVIGTTIDPITERYQFVLFNGDYAEINYSNSDGLKMKFKATKR